MGFVTSLILVTASVGYQYAQARKARKKAAAAKDAAAGIKFQQKGQSVALPIYYGYCEADAYASYWKVKNTYTHSSSSLRYDSFTTSISLTSEELASQIRYMNMGGDDVSTRVAARQEAQRIAAQADIEWPRVANPNLPVISGGLGSPSSGVTVRIFNTDNLFSEAGKVSIVIRRNSTAWDPADLVTTGTYPNAASRLAKQKSNILKYWVFVDELSELSTRGNRDYRVRETSSSSYYDWYHANGLDSNQGGDRSEFLYVQYAVCPGSISKVLGLKVDGKSIGEEDFNNHRIHIKNGVASASPDPLITNNVDDRSSARFPNITYVNACWKINRDEPQYSGIPDLTLLIRGQTLYDVNYNSTTGVYSLNTARTFSNNSARVLLTYLLDTTTGRGLPVSSIDLESFYKAIQICETTVLNNVSFSGYNANFISDSAGWLDTITSSVKRYTFNGSLDSAATARENINTILESMNDADLVFSEGKFKLILYYPTNQTQVNALSVMTVTDNDLIVGDVTITYPSLDTRLNYASVSYKDGNRKLVDNTAEWPERGGSVHSFYLDEDNNNPLNSAIDAVYICDPYTAKAKAEYVVRYSRAATEYKFVMGRRALMLTPGDVIRLQTAHVGKDIYLKIDEISANENFTFNITATYFGWEYLAWNVSDDDPGNLLEDANTWVPVGGPTVSPGTVGVETIISGTLTWEPLQVTGRQHYVVWITDIDHSYRRDLGTTTNTFFELPPLSAGYYVIGIDYYVNNKYYTTIYVNHIVTNPRLIGGGDIAPNGIGSSHVSFNAINSNHIAAQAITVASFATGIEPVTVATGGSLPTTKSTNAIYWNGGLYRWNGSAYTASVNASEIEGTIDAAMIGAIEASKITGQLTSEQIASIEAAKLTGQINSAQLRDNVVTAAKLANLSVNVRHVVNNAINSDKLADLAVNTSHLADRAISSVKLDLLAVNAEHIVNNAINSSKLANLSVNVEHIVNNAINSSKLANLSVNVGHIVNGAINEVKLADNAVTSGKIANAAVSTAKFAAGIEPVTVATGGSLPTTRSTNTIYWNNGLYRWNGTAYTASVNSGDIAGKLEAAQINALAASQITGQLTSEQIAAIEAAKIAGQLNSAQIANNAVTAAKLANLSVNVGHLVNGAISEAKLAANAVTEGKIANGVISAGKFASGIEPVSIHTGGSLPSTKSTNAIYWNGGLYRWNGSAYTASINSADISGKLEAAQINALAASQITGQLTSEQIASIEAAKLTGQITETQVSPNAITLSKLAALPGRNLVVDELFKDQDLWTPQSPSRWSFDGTWSFIGSSITSGTNLLNFSRDVSVEAGSVYKCDFTYTPTTNGNFNLRVTLIWFDLTGATITTSTQAWGVTAGVVGTPISRTWDTPVVPEGAVTARFRLQVDHATTTGNFQLNYVSMVRRTVSGDLLDNAITEAKLAANAVSARQLAEGAVNVAAFAAGIEPVGLHTGGSLPTVKTVNALFWNGGLYRWNGSAYTAAVNANQVSGKLEAAQINALAASQITGQLTSAQIASIEAAKVAGQLSSDQIESIEAAKLTGQIVGSQIANNAISPSKFAAIPGHNLVYDPTFKSQGLWYTQNNARWTWGTGGDLLYTPGGTTWTALRQSVDNPVPCIAGLRYQVNLHWVLGTATQVHARLHITWNRADGSVISTTNLGGVTLTSGPHSFLVTAPAEAVTCLPGVGLLESNIDGTVVIRSIEFLHITSAATLDVNSVGRDAILANAVSSVQLAENAVTAAQIAVNAVTETAISNGAISTPKIVTNAIQTNHIAANAIVASKIAANSINANHVVANSLTANEIAANAITASEIAANAVTANAIAANTITANEIAAGAITAVELAANSVTANQLAANSVTAVAILANTITANEIAANTLTAAEIAANAITTSELSANAVTANQLAANSVTANAIAANTITANEIAANTITANQLAANSVQASEIAANAVTANAIAANAVTTNALAANSVVSATIAAGAVSTNQLAANSIVASKVAIGDFTNLILDPTFREVGVYWIASGSTLSTLSPTNPDTWGSNTILLLTATESWGQALSQPFQVEAGKEYFVSVRTTSWGADPSSTARLTINWKLASTGAWSTVTVIQSVTSTSWNITTLSGSVVAPEGAVEGRIQLQAINAPGAIARFSVPMVRLRATGELLVDGVITSEKVAANAIVASKIAANSINASHVVANSLTANEIAANAITASEIAANSVSTAALQANAVVANRIAANAISTRELAANSITANQLAANAVVAESIAANAIQARNINANAINASHISAGAIEASSLAANSITARELAVNAINASHISANAIVAGAIAAGAVSTDQLASNSIVTKHLAISDTTNYFDGYWNLATSPFEVISGGWISSGEVNQWEGRDTVVISVPSSGIIAWSYTPTLNVSVGEEYYVRFWVKRNAAWNGVSGNSKLRFANDSGTQIWALPYGLTEIPTQGVWVLREGSFTVPTGTNSLQITLTSNATAGSVWLAGLQLRKKNSGSLIVDGTIETAALAANSITGNKIAANTINASHIIANSLTANELAANSVTASEVAANSVYTDALQANAVTIQKLSANSVSANQLAANAVVAESIAANAIQARNINANAINSAHISAGSIETSDLAANAVTAAKIAANSINATHLQANSVVAGIIAAGAVSTNELAANSITTEKLVIGSQTNLLADPDFRAGGTGWANHSNWVISTTTGPSGTEIPVYRVTPTAADSGIFNTDWPLSPLRSVTPGSSFICSLTVRRVSGTAGLIRINAIRRNEPTGANFWVSPIIAEATSLPIGEWVTLTGTLDLTVNNRYLGVRLQCQDAVGSVFEVAEVSMRLRNSGELIVDGAITTEKVFANAIVGTKIAANSINASHIVANSITANELAANSVTASEIASNSVTTVALVANSVTANELAVNSVTANQLAANSVTAVALQANSITAVAIAANAIGANSIAANTIAARHLVVADFTNLVPNADMSDRESWTIPSPWIWSTSGTSAKGTHWTYIDIPSGGSGNAPLVVSQPFSVDAGKEYFFSIEARSYGNSQVVDTVIQVQWLKTNGDQISVVAIKGWGLLTNTLTRYTNTLIAPVEATRARIRWTVSYSSSTAGHRAIIGSPECRLRNSAELIVDGAVISDKVSANAITGVKIAANSINAMHIVANSITASEIAANAIAASELAANSVYAEALQANSVRAVSIAAGAVTTNQLAANAVVAETIAANAITTPKINANAINGSKINAGSINALHLVANAITTRELAANAVEAVHVAANAITAGKIAVGAVSADQIATNAIAARHLAVTDFTNYVPNADISDAASWSIPSPWVHELSGPVYKGTHWTYLDVPSGGATGDSPLVSSQPFSIDSGKEYFCSIQMRSNGTSQQVVARAFIRWYKTDMTVISDSNIQNYISLPSTATIYKGSVTAPAEATRAKIVWVVRYTDSTAGSRAYIGSPEMRLKNNGELIVDGAVEANHINVVNLSAVSAVIGILRTATSGSRMEIRDNRILVYEGSALRIKIGNLL